MRKRFILFLYLTGIALSVHAENLFSEKFSDLKGNWICVDTYKCWILGLYDSTVVYDNRIWELESVQEKRHSLQITLSNQEGKKHLNLRVNKKNDCLYIQDGKENWLCNRTGLKERHFKPSDDEFGNIFRPDTSCFQGIIEGYDSTAYKTGIVFLDDALRDKDQPIVIPIQKDGTFQIYFEQEMPQSVSLRLELNHCPVYIPVYFEPGQTTTLYLNHQEIIQQAQNLKANLPWEKTLYMGPLADINCQIAEDAIYYEPIGEKVYKAAQSLTPNEFTTYIRPIHDQWLQIADSIIETDHYSSKSAQILRNTMRMRAVYDLVYYLKYRLSFWFQSSDSLYRKPTSDEFYAEMKHLPMNDSSLVACPSFGSFFSQIQFSDSIFLPTSWRSDADFLKVRDHNAKTVRRWLHRVSGQDNPWLLQAIRYRDMVYGLEQLEDTVLLHQYYDRNVSTIESGYLRQLCSEALGNRLSPNRSYALPEGIGTNIIRKIIEPYQGKVVLIDFWGTTCGPCRAAIEQSKELRARYRGNSDIVFLFITSESDSPGKDYDSYVEKHLKGENTIRLSSDDFYYLRQLFKFNAIPHYETFTPEGEVFERSFEYNDLNYRFQEYLKARNP